MEKQKYIEPEMTMICIANQIVHTSGGGGGIVLPDDEW